MVVVEASALTFDRVRFGVVEVHELAFFRICPPGHRKTLAKHQCFLCAFECGGASVAQALRSAAIELPPRQLVSKRELAQLPRVREAVNRILLGGMPPRCQLTTNACFGPRSTKPSHKVNFPKKHMLAYINFRLGCRLTIPLTPVASDESDDDKSPLQQALVAPSN